MAALCSSDLIYEWQPDSGAMRWYGDRGTAAPRLPATRGEWVAALHPDDRGRVVAAAERHLYSGGRFDQEYRFQRPDGTVVTWRDRAMVTGGAGRPVRWIGAVTDLTEQRIGEQRGRRAYRMEAVGRIAGGVAHEVNNMTTVIVGLSDLLARTLEPTDAGRSDLREIRRAAERVATLTRQLQAYSRQQVLQPSSLDLNQLVGGLLPLIRRTVGERVDVLLGLGATESQVFADRAQLEEAILNLVLNAEDAMPRGGLLALETETFELGDQAARRHPGVVITPGQYVRLVVSDTGVGMGQDIRARVFEPFFTTKPKGEAAGMGLATTYGIVKQSGGYIWVYSEPGQGTAFQIYLPLHRVPAVLSTPRQRPRRGTETVLLAEDERTVRRVAERVLRAYGYTVRSAASSAEAIERLAAGEGVELLITDAVLPDGTGAELIERARRIRPDLAVLGVSGYSATDAVRRGVLPDGVPFLQKPFAPDELARAVGATLDRAARAAEEARRPSD